MQFNNINLNQLRVLNTRPHAQAAHTTAAIERAGGTSIELPLLDIKATDTSWVNSVPNDIQHAIFISPNAVHHFFEHYSKKNLPNALKTYAIGEGTARALKQYGISNPILPVKSDSEHLLKCSTLQHIYAENCLLIKGKEGRTLIQETLKARGGRLFVIAVYERVPANVSKAICNHLWHTDAVDIILITSQAALTNLFSLFVFESAAHKWLCSKPFLVLSQRLADAVAQHGARPIMI